MKKLLIIISSVLGSLALASLIGLACTGFCIGWGPFSTLRYINKKDYKITQTHYSYKRTRIEIPGPNGVIRGNLFMPKTNKDKNQIIILSHGLATEQWHNLNTANTLASTGIIVFMFDYCGGSIHAKSDGKTTDMSILTEKQDLNTVIDKVKTWDFVDTSKIGVIGYSQGGLVAAMTAVERDDIYRLCLLYPAFSMVDEVKKSDMKVGEIDEVQNRNGMLVGKRYYEDVLSLPFDNIYEYVASYQKPVMIQHGTKDLLVPYQSSVTADNYYPNSQLYKIENGAHGFVGQDDVYSVKLEYEFFTK